MSVKSNGKLKACVNEVNQYEGLGFGHQISLFEYSKNKNLTISQIVLYVLMKFALNRRSSLGVVVWISVQGMDTEKICIQIFIQM